MARPESTKRRVSHLVGRFEQLAASNPESDSGAARNACDNNGEEARPRSHHGEIYLKGQAASRFGQSNSTVVISSDSATETPLIEDKQHRKAMQGECEAMRKRSRDDGESSDNLKSQLEEAQLSCQGYEEQRKYMERKIECMRQQLSSRDQTEKDGRERADAEVEELRQQLSLSEETRRTDRENAKVESQREQNLLAVKLRDAQSRADSALKDAQNLERQLLDLKQSMSTSTRISKQATDQEISEKMGRFGHEVQNWIVSNFRKVKIGRLMRLVVVEGVGANQTIDKPSEMKTRYDSLPVLAGSKLLYSLFHNFDNASKLFALQGTVMYLMMRILKDDYFSELPQELRALQECAAVMKCNRLAVGSLSRTRH